MFILVGIVGGAIVATCLSLNHYLPQIRDLLIENRDLLKKATAHLDEPEEKK